jgi:hypothetical protein
VTAVTTAGAATQQSSASPDASGSDDSPGGDATAAAGEDATAVSGGVGSISGGSTDVPRQAVSTVPPPPPGKTPVIDPTTIADPGAAPPPNDGQGGGSGGDATALQLAIDLDSATPGIQTTRDIAVGDIVRVGVVVLNVPAGPGISAFNFEVDYDKTKAVAPTYAGGEATDRNPDLNDDAVGAGWSCLPAPQGDLDDEGGTEGDGNPATGQAFLSCFVSDGNKTGTVVVATIEFHAVAAGTLSLSLSNVNIGVGDGIEVARCGDSDAHVVPCAGATLTVR